MASRLRGFIVGDPFPVTRSHHQEFAGDPPVSCHAGVTHQQSSISRVVTKPVEANPRFSVRGGAIRGVAVQERGGVSSPDHQGGAGLDIDSTCSGRGRVTHDPVPIRPVAIPNFN